MPSELAGRHAPPTPGDTHCPAAHVLGGSHGMPQSPQLLGSTSVSVHSSSQTTSPEGQPVAVGLGVGTSVSVGVAVAVGVAVGVAAAGFSNDGTQNSVGRNRSKT